MKKTIYILSIFAALLLVSCENFNEKNFPGYDEAAAPTNLQSYSYTLTPADYTIIANAIKKPVTDSISVEKAKLKNAKTKADSTIIDTEIKRLELRLTTAPVYVNATEIANNKYFSSLLVSKDAIPLLLNQKYSYADIKSSVKVTFDFVNGGDTTSIPANKKFILTEADYLAMGTGVNQPGQFKNFSANIAPQGYINNYLKSKNPYASKNEVCMVRYVYFNKTAQAQYRLFIFDGVDWKSSKTEQYLFAASKKWLFDPTIYIVQVTNDRTKDADGLPGNMTNLYSVIVHNVWNNENLKKFVSSFKNDEYYYGASAYQGNFSFQYSTREGSLYNDLDLKALQSEEAKIDFMFNRANEAIIIYLKYTYPDAKPITTDGLDQFFAVTFRVYERYASSTTTNNYQAIFQCTGANPATFKFIERKKI